MGSLKKFDQKMLKIFGSSKQLRTALYQCRCKISNDAQPIKHQPETLPNNTSSETSPVKADTSEKVPYDQKNVKKEDLIWRTPWHQKDGVRYDTLRTFYREDNNTSILKWIQTPINLSPKAIKKWFNNKLELEESRLQLYVPERHQILGPELATAHFIVYRGGAVKFHNEDKWVKAVDGDYELPSHYKKDMYIQAIDCTDMNLYYEGLDNLRGLKNVEWLSLNGCNRMDDFCIDVVSNIFSHSLVYLDLRNCFNITANGIGSLYKMKKLKILYLDDLLKDTKYELITFLLQDILPNLDIKSDVINFEIK